MSTSPFAIIIPARYASSRYPAKPLAPLVGATGIAKPLIQRSWECAMQIVGAVGVWVATDDDRIADVVTKFGGQVIITSPDRENGTARCAEAAAQIAPDVDIIVNLQGDAPLSPAFVVTDLVNALAAEPDVIMATPAVRCSHSTYNHLLADRAAGRVGGTTVVIGQGDRAIYFSKEVLPFLPSASASQPIPPVHLHLGLYAYRRAALERYVAAPPCELEQLEGLEQLRFLDLGLPVRVVRIDELAWDSIELNNPSDSAIIERVLRERGIA
jgi:3-deoxy-manno-octulosonate cytidylyltransferase (CMP-KDO synthetase)